MFRFPALPISETSDCSDPPLVLRGEGEVFNILKLVISGIYGDGTFRNISITSFEDWQLS